MRLKSRASGDTSDPVIELQNVTFCAPRDSNILISNISLQLSFGNNLLITELAKDTKPKDEDIDSILSFIKYVELEHVLLKAGLFDKVDWNWYDVLSPGECQRLSFVKLVLP
ncbi:hypothetical protein CEXT_251911 [Caerostris extrusa]|uniref:ABC transporter domain-containing protein n=1 Tax=Caerostris extrusa TaxID=172846 RepID=A0AAV4WCE8_CAEEX|nr:hypothetical protein CEXT_251911 [Caerostris extrusa]